MNSKDQFVDIYDKYVDRIYRFVIVKVNSAAVAQDLTSETFTRTLEYFTRNPQVRIENMQAFLYRTATNIVTDFYRQKSRQDVPLNYETEEIVQREIPENERPDRQATLAEQGDHIRAALAKMEGERADVLMWHYIEDISIKEIASMLDKPEGTIRVMLHRGLKELREIL